MTVPLEDVAEFLETAASHMRAAIMARDHRDINERIVAEIQEREARLAELNQSISDVEGAHSKRVREMDAQLAQRQQRILDLDTQLTKLQETKSKIEAYVNRHFGAA